MNENDALTQLNKEREYEDKLASDLSDYFLQQIDNITDLNEEEKTKIKKNLTIIRDESRKHSYMFDQMVNMVMQHGQDNY